MSECGSCFAAQSAHDKAAQNRSRWEEGTPLLTPKRVGGNSQGLIAFFVPGRGVACTCVFRAQDLTWSVFTKPCEPEPVFVATAQLNPLLWPLLEEGQDTFCLAEVLVEVVEMPLIAAVQISS